MDIQKSIRMAIDTGEVLLGKNESLRSINDCKSKLVIVASNLPPDIILDIRKRATLGSIPMYEYAGTSMELGSICGKPYPISIMSIMAPGDSDILSVVKK
jgi:large subunit ribosomal protein L30e